MKARHSNMKFINVGQLGQSEFAITKPEKIVFYLENFSGTLDIDIQHENAEVFIFGLYVGRNSDKFDVKTIQRHSVGNSLSDLLIKGVFFDKSKFTYEGLIRIEKGAQLSNAYQKNQNLVMSDKTFVDSRPFLEINANDVRCTHGSTTGQLNREQLLYLHTRGLAPKKAEEVLVQGFIGDVKQKMLKLGVKSSEVKDML